MSATTNNNSTPTPQQGNGTAPRQYKYLTPKRKSAYKQLFVMGRIFPWTIHGAYVHEDEPMTMEQIAADWGIPLEAVQEAIEYYESEPPEMLEDFRREDAHVKASGLDRQSPATPFTHVLLTPQQRAEIDNE